ncbi:hypothetical protein BX600DRAFT_469626 [Xylariales sp. PMI_506]|nr:hypothetical protein BX600DRAFT_469626 [Xylariales sp. PMI_506]
MDELGEPPRRPGWDVETSAQSVAASTEINLLQQAMPLQPGIVTNPRQHALGSHGFTQNELSRTFSSWYTSEATTVPTDLAKEAYDRAIEVLKENLSPAECDVIWLRGKNSMRDVQVALLEAELAYQNRSSKGKIRSMLTSCSSRVAYYAPVLDALVQHYPEYTSLAWGTFKFLFTAMLNYEELLQEFSRATIAIANVLPRTRLLYELYPTSQMIQAVGAVYAKIIQFVIETVKWYKKNRLQHAVAAVMSPYKLSFKSIVDEIAERSRAVDELANAAMKAELRDVHQKVEYLYDENSSLRRDVFDMKQSLLMVKDQFRSMTQAMIQSQSLQNQLLMGQQSQSSLMIEWQVESIRQALEATGASDGSSMEMLTFCRSMRNRRRIRNPSQVLPEEIGKVKSWAEDNRSSLLIAEGRGIRSSAIDFAADFIDVMLGSRFPVIWALPQTFEDIPSLIAIIQSLVAQTMNLQIKSKVDRRIPITVHELRNASTLGDWLDILEKCISIQPRVYIVLDLNLLRIAAQTGEEHRHESYCEEVVQKLYNMVNNQQVGCAKVVLISETSQSSIAILSNTSLDVTRVTTDRGIAQERKFWHPRYRPIAQQRLTRTLRQLRNALGTQSGS